MAVGGQRGQWLRTGLTCVVLAMGVQIGAKAEPPQALAILLRELQAKPLGIYDGVRLFRINRRGGNTLTLTVSCEREEWRVQSRENAFFDAPFLSAAGIARTWVCMEPVRVLE
jgi:hypothetical protein